MANEIKRLVSLLFLFCCLCLSVKAQDYRLLSFGEMEGNSMIARENMMEDENGKKCAVICISTQDINPEMRLGFYFESDWGSYIVQKTVVDAEIWVWVSPGLKTLVVKHAILGKISVAVTEHVPRIESLHTYKMVLKGTMKNGIDNPFLITQQFLMLEVTPKDAIVTVDGTPWQVTDGVASGRVNFGNHDYRVEAADYHTETGSVMVDDRENTVTKSIDLKPAFGFLKIDGDKKILSKSSIFIDNTDAASALNTPLKLASGRHKLRIVNAKYKPYERDVDIFDGETYTYTVNLDGNFSMVTLKVDADADIYVNGQMKGVRSWTGELEAGTYLIECRMKSHRSTKVQKTITDNMNGQTIQLEVPKPINGILVVNSNPPKAKIIIDGVAMGKTPKQFNAVLIGEHTIRLEKEDCFPLVKTIIIEEGKTLSLDEKLDTVPSVAVKTVPQRGVNFVTVDFAYSPAPLTSYGLTFGSVKKIGWFVSAASNFSFDASNYGYIADSQGYIGDEYPDYTGKTCSTRLSAMAGMVVKIGGPVYMKLGAGYGNRVKSWYTSNGSLVTMDKVCYKGLDATAGLLLNLKGFSLSFDAVTTNFKTIEAKLGVGFCWKRK